MSATLDILEPDSCEGCGLCCQRNGSPPLVYQTRASDTSPHPHRPAGLPQSLIEQIDQQFLGLERGQEPPGPCIWYDGDAQCCSHYEWRPQACIDYELGGTACLEERRLAHGSLQ